MLPLPSLLEDLDSNQAAAVSGLNAPGAALLASRLAPSRSLVIITPDTESAQSFTRDLSLFTGGTGPGYLPPSESLPFEQLTPDVDTAAARISALASLTSGEKTVVIPADALLQPVPPPGTLDRWVLTVREGDSLDRDQFTVRLAAMGYRRKPVAAQVGDMAVRGGILDIFSPLSQYPVRIELWDEDIQSIRYFDPETQRSAGPAHDRPLFPVTELLLETGELEEAADRIGRHLTSAGVGAAGRERTLSQFLERTGFPGLSSYLPLAYGQTFYPLDHLHEGTLILLFEPREIKARFNRFAALALDRHNPSLPEPGLVYQDPDKLYDEITSRPGIASRGSTSPMPIGSRACHPFPTAFQLPDPTASRS